MHHSSWLSTWVWGIQTQILTLAQWIQLSSLLGLTALKITNLFKISPSSLKAFVWVWPPILVSTIEDKWPPRISLNKD